MTPLVPMTSAALHLRQAAQCTLRPVLHTLLQLPPPTMGPAMLQGPQTLLQPRLQLSTQQLLAEQPLSSCQVPSLNPKPQPPSCSIPPCHHPGATHLWPSQHWGRKWPLLQPLLQPVLQPLLQLLLPCHSYGAHGGRMSWTKMTMMT